MLIVWFTSFTIVFADEVSWIPGVSSPADWSIAPDNPTTSDVISFSGPTAIFGNDCYGNQFMGGTPTLTIDPINKSIELWFQPPAPDGCYEIWAPVCGLQGSFGPLKAGQWVFSGAIPWPGQEGDSFWIPFEVTGSIYYVDADATGAGDGLSWDDAFIFLQHALSEAIYYTSHYGLPAEIRVAQGTYKPNEGVLAVPEFDWRTVTFQLINNVVIKGGYAGCGEADPDARDVDAYETILSGDLLGNDGPDFANNSENSYHVVTGSGRDATAVLNGFTITAGNADGAGGGLSNRGGGMSNYDNGSPTITNCMFKWNTAEWGGGMCNANNSNPTVTNCTFSNNYAQMVGGGMYNLCSISTLTNCTFIGNSGNYGGGIFCGYGMMHIAFNDLTITNCTFSGNTAEYGGAVAVGEGSDLLIVNSILWGNSATYGSEIAMTSLDWGSHLSISYSDIQGGQAGIYDVSRLDWSQGNIDVDPLFVDAVNDDYHLKSEGWRWDAGFNPPRWTYDYGTSPCIDAGNPGCPLGNELLTIPDDPYHDWGVNLRINMGAYGGTAEASMPPYDWALLGDLSNDGIIDYVDLGGQVKDWLTTASQQPGDLNRDGIVNMADFALLVQDWLAKTSWYKPPIVLEIYALGCWGVYLLDTITMPEEGEITITSELPPQSSYAFVYAFRKGYYTEIYKLDESNTINVDLDPIVPTKFNGTIFLTDPFFTALYLADTDVNVIDGDTVVGQFRTDEQGRFAIEMEPGNYYFEFYECASGFGGYHREEVEIQGQYKDFFFHYDSMVDKPNIYLYPEETIEVDVNIVFPHGGRLRTSIPEYGDGWHITVEPSGIIDGQYDCLFYESLQPDYGQYEAGWVVAQGQLEGFFRDNMALTGFNQKEIDDFIEYWIPRLTEYPYYAIYPQYNDELEEMIKLEFSEQPTNLIRLIYSVRGLETGNLTLDEAVIPAFNRDGFTVAEWGVILKQ